MSGMNSLHGWKISFPYLLRAVTRPLEFYPSARKKLAASSLHRLKRAGRNRFVRDFQFLGFLAQSRHISRAHLIVIIGRLPCYSFYNGYLMQSFKGPARTAPLFPVVADRSERFLVVLPLHTPGGCLKLRRPKSFVSGATMKRRKRTDPTTRLIEAMLDIALLAGFLSAMGILVRLAL